MIIINQTPNTYITYGQMNLINGSRAYWTEIAIWIRSFMVSTITGFSNLPSISDRLCSIPSKFSKMFAPCFGAGISEQFQQLLLMYLVHAQSFITAKNINDQQAADSAASSLYKTSDEIADFLARTNPYWDSGQWQYLLYTLNEMIIAEAAALLFGDYEKELVIRDSMFKHVLTIGDYMASGVMHYFDPEKFPAE